MRLVTWMATVGLLLGPTTAQAHFLFTRICPPAEGGRVAETYFSEYASAGDPRYIARTATATFSVQTTPGKFRPLEMQRLSDRLRGHVPLSGPLMVAGNWDYGVIARPGETPFLLRHYTKAVAGKPEEVNKLQARGSRLEVVASFEADGVALTALLDGKPVPQAKFTTVAPDLTSEELQGDTSGQATFKPETSGYFCVYTGHIDPTAGEHAGKAYQEIREFATVAFSWPLAPTGADPEAVQLFEEALASRAAWKGFPGFSGRIVGTIEGRPFDGKVTVAADGGVTLEIDDAPLTDWVQSQLESITMHRAASQTPSAERPKPVVRFADNDTEHPLGRLLAFDGGHFATSYRVRDKQLTTVNRLLDGKCMTIAVLDNTKNSEGQFLPHVYTVQYWDEASGRLERTETVQDQWVRVGQWDLPREHTLTTSADSSFSTRSFTIRDHTLLQPATK